MREDPTTYDSLIAAVAKAPDAKVDPLAGVRMIGQTFGSYRIVAELGAGGMGAVFLAEHVVLGGRAAIKVLRPEYSVQQQVVQRFFDEARAATRIADPGIVAVYDFGWHASGAAYLVMEHLPGESVAQRIRRAGRIAPGPALALVRQCAMAMAAAHARGIVHRDLKPDNIFITPDPAIATERVKILDFGIAKLLDDDASHAGTQSGVILGTPGYMSPEQCRGAGEVDHRTDVYALGCVMFAMLCGTPPFVAATPADLIAAHLTMRPPMPGTIVPGMPPALEALVVRCLEKDVARRVQSMPDLVAAIDAIAGVSSAVRVAAAVPAASVASVVGPRRRGRWWIGAAALALVLAASATIAVVAARRGGKESPAAGAAPSSTAISVDAAPATATSPTTEPAGAAIAPAPDAAVERAPARGKREPRGKRPVDASTPRAATGSGSGTPAAGSAVVDRPGPGSAATGSGSGSAGYDYR